MAWPGLSSEQAPLSYFQNAHAPCSRDLAHLSVVCVTLQADRPRKKKADKAKSIGAPKVLKAVAGVSKASSQV